MNAANTLLQIYGPTGKFAQYGPVLGPWYAINAAGSQGILQCGMRRIASYAYAAKQAGAITGDSYLYSYGLRGGGLGDALGPVHGLELSWVYNKAGAPFANTQFTPDEQKFANVMSSYWSNFIANGNPNDSTGNKMAATGSDKSMPTGYTYQSWPAYEPTHNPTLVWGDQNTLDNFTLQTQDYNTVYPQCPYWDQVCNVVFIYTVHNNLTI
jgi:carboxylesterase type B